MPNKILIIEDHPAVNTMLSSLFRNHGYTVDVAFEGHSGLEAIERGGYSAILLDLQLPEMDGFSILKTLQDHPPAIPNGPTIVFSNTTDPNARKQSLEFGAASFIPKENLDTLKLVQQVEETINTQKNIKA